MKLKKEVANLQKLLSADSSSMNNTSSHSLLPSEFVEMWKELITQKLVDAFANFYENQPLFIMLIQGEFLSKIWNFPFWVLRMLVNKDL